MLNAPLTTPPCRPRDETRPSSAATADASRPSKAESVELPADVWLRVAATGVDAFWRVADTLPGLRRDLLQPAYLRQVLLNEGYPSRSLPAVGTPGARLELCRRLQAHRVLDALLPAQATPATALPVTFRESGGKEVPTPTRTSNIYADYRLSAEYALEVRPDKLTGRQEVLCAAYPFPYRAPTWRQLDIPAGWETVQMSPNGRWAYASDRLSIGPVASFRLFDLSRSNPLACHTGSYWANAPEFSADSQALLFADIAGENVRLNRVDLQQSSTPLVSRVTSVSSDSGTEITGFSPQGHHATFSTINGVFVYSIINAASATKICVNDHYLQCKPPIWSNDEAHLRFFHLGSQRAATFSLNHPVAQLRSFAPEGDVVLSVQACHGEHLLTVRPQGGDEIWQLYDWHGKAASAQVTLPQGRRNRESQGELIGSRALLTQASDPNSYNGFTFFVDFAEASPVPLALGSNHRFELSGYTQTDSDWLVGTDNGWPPSCRLVNTSHASGRRGQTVHFSNVQNKGIHVRADGKAALVGHVFPQGLYAYRLAP